MRDGFEDPVLEAHKAKLSYPFPGGPDQGEAVDVAPGVKWLRMPLGGSLAWINVWAIREAGGWAIVDTGLGGQPGSRGTRPWRGVRFGQLRATSQLAHLR